MRSSGSMMMMRRRRRGEMCFSIIIDRHAAIGLHVMGNG